MKPSFRRSARSSWPASVAPVAGDCATQEVRPGSREIPQRVATAEPPTTGLRSRNDYRSRATCITVANKLPSESRGHESFRRTQNTSFFALRLFWRALSSLRVGIRKDGAPDRACGTPGKAFPAAPSAVKSRQVSRNPLCWVFRFGRVGMALALRVATG